MSYAVLAELEATLQRLHTREQAIRFARIFGFSAVTAVIATHGQALTWSAVGSIAIAALETTFRAFYPAVTTENAQPHIDAAIQTTALNAAEAAIAAVPPAVQ